MTDWKMILKVVLGCAVLMVLIIFGLSKMSGSNSNQIGALNADESKLEKGAKLIRENGTVKVTVVNFSDMQCPACKQAHELTAGLMNLPGVRVIFRHFPLSIHQNASIAATAVEAARQMGKGWEMIDLLYSRQGEWNAEKNIEAKIIDYAKTLNLDSTEFKTRLESSESAAVVKQDIDLGDSLYLSGTPTIYVNGEQVAADFVEAKVKELLK